ncbi:MBL fold metallo-hydrolase [Caulobacter sp. BE254]|uniref:MBL fold metallo-hydrolase n=1 Tax=Caulobacter sp. BE254 TaxID=2817720 RepID=UPI002863A704|nr:MBL fold metallo-hydrolase [Caulobacter sp. BE254]MDR7118692.1 L-ascorbate metabolism protein UlaG (beta-lactamase superfamily) [Caulobacter sp. BE254]
MPTHLNPQDIPPVKIALTRRSLLGGGATALLASAPPFAAEAGTLRIQRLAWAGIKLVLPDATLGVDLLADPSVWGAALPDPLPDLGDFKGDRYALITHRHSDHFDAKAVARALGDQGLLLYPASLGAIVAPGVSRVRSAPLWEPQMLGGAFVATAVPAVDGYGDPQASWVISGGGRRILHAGDTLWHGAWWQVGRQFGPFDAVFLPINGARFAWREPAAEVSSVMTPDQAVAAAKILGARILVPIHYGVRGADGYEEMSDALQRTQAEGARRGVTVQALKPGAWLNWDV